MTITFDSLTADELRVGDVFVENDEVTHEVVATAKSTSTGDVFLKLRDHSEEWPVVLKEDDPAPGYVRAAQWQAHTAELAEVAAAEEDEAEPEVLST